MSSFVSRGLLTALVAGGSTLLGATAAQAAELGDHHGTGGQHAGVLGLVVGLLLLAAALLGGALRSAVRRN